MYVESVFQICEEHVKSGDEDFNFLIDFMKKNPHLVTYKLAFYVASDLMRSTITLAFGSSIVFAETPTKQKPAKRHLKDKDGNVKKKPRSLEQQLSKVCTIDHEDLDYYRVIETGFYFASDRKYCDAVCRKCLEHYETDYHKDKPKPGIHLPKASHPAYVCVEFELDNCVCGNFLCHSCYDGLIATSGGKRKRRCPAKA